MQIELPGFVDRVISTCVINQDDIVNNVFGDGSNRLFQG